MTPRPLNAAVVGARLDQMRTILRTMEGAGEMSRERLEAEPLTRAAVERFLQALVDLAVDINAHLAVAELDEAPVTAKRSFDAAARAGVISSPLATALAPAAGLRNILVHAYLDIDLDKVAAAVPRVEELFSDYVRQVATYVLSETADDEMG
jgi:uncharacterized protein YutE (UPF0331/DUF86 family)